VRPQSASIRRPVIAAVLLAAAFTVLAILVICKSSALFDAAVIRLVQGWEAGWLTPIMIFFTKLGTGLPALALGVAVFLMLLAFRLRLELLIYLLAAAGSPVLNWLLKAAFHLARPDIHRLVVQGGYGFPSGHAMGAITFYGITAYFLWCRIRAPSGRSLVLAVSVVLILAIGLSRIYLGVHYPTDVIGGYLAGGSLLAACIAVSRLIKN
jgi:undecaprenyl-diphosphatase